MIYKVFKALPNPQNYHHIKVENNRIIDSLLIKTCPCFNSVAAAETSSSSNNTSKLPVKIGQFYKLGYYFLDQIGGAKVKVLPAIHSKVDLEEKLFTFMKEDGSINQ